MGDLNLFYLTKTTHIILTANVCCLRSLCSLSAFTLQNDSDPNLNSEPLITTYLSAGGGGTAQAVTLGLIYIMLAM
jgi:hypothetical protein